MDHSYSYWRDALAGQDMSKRTHDGDPHPGFYRMRSKNKQTGAVSWTPVAYYFPEGLPNIVCRIGQQIVTADRAQEVWSYVCRYPVTEEQWRAVAEQGKPWHDQDQIVSDQIGHNNPPADPDEQVARQIEEATLGLGKYRKITTEEQSQQAQSLRSRLLELARSAEGIFKRKSEGHLAKHASVYKEAVEIKETWKPKGEAARAAAASLKLANDAYLTSKLQAQRAAEKAAEGTMEEVAPQVPTQIRGAYGRAASVKPQWALTKITDQDAVYRHFSGHAAVKECLEDLAKKAIKDGAEIPGTEREERAVSR